MKKKVLIGTTIAAALLISGTAMAATLTSPAEKVSDLTGISVEQVYEQRQAGKTYGAIANENGMLDEFKDDMFEQKKAIIDERVEEGIISKEDAEAFKKEMEERIKECDGTPDPGRERLGQEYGGGMRFGGGFGNGAGMGRGAGCGMRNGRGYNR